jgi:hypothetical protein
MSQLYLQERRILSGDSEELKEAQRITQAFIAIPASELFILAVALFFMVQLMDSARSPRMFLLSAVAVAVVCCIVYAVAVASCPSHDSYGTYLYLAIAAQHPSGALAALTQVIRIAVSVETQVYFGVLRIGAHQGWIHVGIFGMWVPICAVFGWIPNLVYAATNLLIWWNFTINLGKLINGDNAAPHRRRLIAIRDNAAQHLRRLPFVARIFLAWMPQGIRFLEFPLLGISAQVAWMYMLLGPFWLVCVPLSWLVCDPLIWKLKYYLRYTFPWMLLWEDNGIEIFRTALRIYIQAERQ